METVKPRWKIAFFLFIAAATLTKCQAERYPEPAFNFKFLVEDS